MKPTEPRGPCLPKADEPRSGDTSRCAPQATAGIGEHTEMQGLAIANALEVNGDLCHRYAVQPSWLRWFVGLPWVGTHGYNCASPLGLDQPQAFTGTATTLGMVGVCFTTAGADLLNVQATSDSVHSELSGINTAATSGLRWPVSPATSVAML